MTYTEEQIKAAFFAKFHGAGEFWFPSKSSQYATAEESEAATEHEWADFLKHLRRNTGQ